MELSTLLSRIQFGFTIGFHILFPTLNIGLAIFLSIMEGIWVKTHNPLYQKICQFWGKIFALTFGMGVVSGIVLSYELGTNFGVFIAAVGSVLGPLFSYEVLSAFFLEAGFLGIMLFGWQRVGARLHYFSTLMVTIGTIISAFWIMSANSWMQTPSGYLLASNGHFLVNNWWQVIFNPSFMPRYIHMLFASLITCSFVVAGVSAWFLIKNRHLNFAKACLSFTFIAALILTPLQIVIGDIVGLKMHEYQPLKTAAIEADWETMRDAPLILFAIPDQTKAQNFYSLAIPYGASLFNTHNLHGELVGLKSVSPKDWPRVLPVFFSFRVMVGIGFIFLFISIYAFWLRKRNRLYMNKHFLRLCVLLSPFGFIASIAGWLTAELGRQPWIVYSLMRTESAASPVPAGNVIISLILFVCVYGVIFSFYLFYLFKSIAIGPTHLEELPMTATYIPLHREDE